MLLNNRYKVIKVIGAGGFGETFLASDNHIPSRRYCAIKQLKTTIQNPQTYQLVQKRFEREAVALELLGACCDQIPTLYAYFSDNNQFYIVQEFIHGQTLANQIEAKGALDEIAVTQIIVSTLNVLDYIHSKGIIHRDIKPDNIIIRSSDRKPVLIDLGAIKETIRSTTTNSRHFTSSLIIGTPGYMASEQAIGRPVYATDIYSLGLTAIYLLTGKTPQELSCDQQTGEIIWQHYAPSISSHLAKVLTTAIKPNAGERFSTASKMLHALRASTSNFTNTQATKIISPVVKLNPKYAQYPIAYSTVLRAVVLHCLQMLLPASLVMLLVSINSFNSQTSEVPVATSPTPLSLVEVPVATSPTPALTSLPLVKAPAINPTLAPSVKAPVAINPNFIPSQTAPLPNLQIPKIPNYPNYQSVTFPKNTIPTSITLPKFTKQNSAAPINEDTVQQEEQRVNDEYYKLLLPLILPTPKESRVLNPSVPSVQSAPESSNTSETLISLERDIERLRNKYREMQTINYSSQRLLSKDSESGRRR